MTDQASERVDRGSIPCHVCRAIVPAELVLRCSDCRNLIGECCAPAGPFDDRFPGYHVERCRACELVYRAGRPA